ncbi:unnamed protein product [Ectocarpus sp. 13 AM-2016]
MRTSHLMCVQQLAQHTPPPPPVCATIISGRTANMEQALMDYTAVGKWSVRAFACVGWRCRWHLVESCTNILARADSFGREENNSPWPFVAESSTYVSAEISLFCRGSECGIFSRLFHDEIELQGAALRQVAVPPAVVLHEQENRCLERRGSET